MQKLKTKLIDKCRKLRIRGYSLGEISFATSVAKSTLYGYTKDIYLDPNQKKDIEIRRKEKNKNMINPRKGKCLPGREIIKPKFWSVDLVHIIAHFMFDGRVDQDSCIYYSKDWYQIIHMKKLLEKIFKAKPKIQLRNNGVYGLVFYHVELAKYIKICKDKIFFYLNNGAAIQGKRIFLRAFFDDEGCVSYNGDKRRVRGYQKSGYIMGQVKNLLTDFDIKGRINKGANEIEISGQDNLLKFAQEINFSSKIYINPKRKNGIWKKKISKREILNLALKAYNKNR